MSVAPVLSRRENPDKLGRRVGDGASITAVLRVLPAGSRPARSQGSWVRAVEAHPDVLLRADAKRNLHALVWELVRWADWETLTSRPTWERLGRAAGLSRSTVAKWLAWLRERDLLAIVQHGTTPLIRPGVLYNGTEGNLASVYVLCEPSGRDEASQSTEDRPDEISLVHESQTPSWKPTTTARQIARARENPSPSQSGRDTMTASRIPPNSDSGGLTQAHNHKNATKRAEARAKIASPRPLWRPTRTRFERLALCERLHEESPPLHAAGSVRRLCHLLRPWLLAGWSARSLLYAIDHTPDQAPWPYAWRSVRELRNPAGWLLHRLRAWRDRDGQMLSDPYAVEMSHSTERIVTAHRSPVASNCPAQPMHVQAVAARLRGQLRERRHKRQADAAKSRDTLAEVPLVPEVPK